MIANFTPQKDLSEAELFFAQKSMELVFPKTIDTYRAKLHNPLSILKELYQVLKDYQDNKIKNFEITVDAVAKETLESLGNENELIFSQVNKESFVVMLKELKKVDYRPVQYAIQIVLAENKNYGLTLYDAIAEEISRINKLEEIDSPLTYNKLARILNQTFSYLLAVGYSKEYLYRLIYKLFSSTSSHSFHDSFEYLKSLSVREPEDYQIIFSLRTTTSNSLTIQSKFILNADDIKELESINSEADAFFERSRKVAGKGKAYYLGIPCKGLDYFSVIREARKIHGSVIDMLHLGFPTYQIQTHNNALVVGSKEPEKTSERSANYVIDGSFKNNQKLYDKFATKMIEVAGSKNVSGETKNKIISAVRYLRLGWEAIELEQKFVNFWIGLEYIFSNYDVEENTIKRMKSYFVNAHSLVYLKRNLHEFHRDLVRLKVTDEIPGFSTDMLYLKEVETYDYLITNFTKTNPLLAFRASKYREWISDSKARKSRIQRHQDNIERHLARLYRVRNEIVHDAAIHINIEVLTGNLRYYLSFVLNSLLEYFTSYENSIGDYDGQLTIDDFFIHQGIILRSIQHQSYPLDDLFNVKSVTEIFS